MSRLLFAWVVCVLLASQGRALNLNMLKQSAGAFSSSLLDLADTKLGVQYIQEYYNTLQYSQIQKNASIIAHDLARETAELFTTQKIALKKLKEFIEGIYADQSFVTSGRLECCNAQNLTNDYEFIAPISKETSCDRVSAIADDSAPSIYDRLNHIYRANDQAPLKWQYFGSEFGVANQFPAVRAPDCGSYDPRFRPWYISTATPNPKDVVLAIKNSWFLQAGGRKRLFEAATIILRTLNPRDRVAMVLYNKEVRKPAIGGCYATNLSLATPANIRKFQNFLDAAPPPYAGNNVSLTLRTAYEYFCSDKLRQGMRRERAILLFTDGERIDDPEERTVIENHVRHYTTSLAFNITLFIFTASDPGAGITREVQRFYRGLVSMNNNASISNTRHYIQLPSSGDLRQNMADFYSRFAATAQQTDQYAPVINVPYRDVFGLDQLVITISTPCYADVSGPTLVGVAALDLTLSDLLAGVEYFREGELSYAFLIDSEGFVLFHPLLPSPSGNDSAVYLDISTLEPQPMFSSVREAMISGGSGCMVLNTTQVVSRGSNAYDGTRTVLIPTNYCWAPVDGTPFSLCVVIPLISHLSELSGGPFQIPISAHYHRLDILADDDQLCSHLSYRATKAYSTVVLCPEAFARPDMYILEEETRESILYTLEALTTLDDGMKQIFRQGILQSVAATAKVEDVWLNDSLSDFQHIAWRYIATGNGVIRVYPGMQVATKQLNALQRPWYQRAVAHLGLLSISPPYDSGLGYGRIMTLSQAILPSDCLGSHSDNHYCGALAVMGMDMTHAYFSLLLHNNIPLCSQSKDYMCLLIDSNAYIVAHPNFTAETLTGELSYHHLAELEPLIARDMVGMGYLQRVYCNNFQYNADFTKRPRRQYSYEVTEKVISATEPLEGGYSTFCTFYQVAPILGTNVFLIVVELARSSHGRCAHTDCSCCDADTPCSSLPTDCICPCSQDIPPSNYNPCLESFSGLSASACPTRFSLEDLESPIAGIPTNGTLPMCFEPTCDPSYSETECLSVLACECCSCPENSVDECRVEGTCPTCMSTPNPTPLFDDTDAIVWQAIAGTMLALAILLTCLLVIFVCLYLRERIKRKKGQLGYAAKPRLQIYTPSFEIGSLSITSKQAGSFLSSPVHSAHSSTRHTTSRQLSCPADMLDTSSSQTDQGPSPDTEDSHLPETDGSFSNITGVSPNPSNAGGIWF